MVLLCATHSEDQNWEAKTLAYAGALPPTCHVALRRCFTSMLHASHSSKVVDLFNSGLMIIPGAKRAYKYFEE